MALKLQISRKTAEFAHFSIKLVLLLLLLFSQVNFVSREETISSINSDVIPVYTAEAATRDRHETILYTRLWNVSSSSYENKIIQNKHIYSYKYGWKKALEE